MFGGKAFECQRVGRHLDMWEFWPDANLARLLDDARSSNVPWGSIFSGGCLVGHSTLGSFVAVVGREDRELHEEASRHYNTLAYPVGDDYDAVRHRRLVPIVLAAIKRRTVANLVACVKGGTMGYHYVKEFDAGGSSSADEPRVRERLVPDGPLRA